MAFAIIGTAIVGFYPMSAVSVQPENPIYRAAHRPMGKLCY
jgi:hypothetical protein